MYLELTFYVQPAVFCVRSSYTYHSCNFYQSNNIARSYFCHISCEYCILYIDKEYKICERFKYVYIYIYILYIFYSVCVHQERYCALTTDRFSQYLSSTALVPYKSLQGNSNASTCDCGGKKQCNGG